jgi:hypothetical protein
MRATVSLLGRLGRLTRAQRAVGRMLGGFVDTLLQTFENCRPGLSDEQLRSGAGVAEFFTELYEKERPQLLEAVARETHLAPEAQAALAQRVDERIRKVVIPAYTRLAAPLSRRERNDFYLTPESLHLAERLAWAAGGMMLGTFVVWAPFIPLWEKEWVIPFMLAGLVFPELRRWLALRRYQAELNALVTRTDEEVWRLDLQYLTGGRAAEAVPAAGPGEAQEGLGARLEGLGQPDAAPAPGRRREKQGGR